MSREINSCEDLLALSLDRADGRTPSEEETLAIEEHLSMCEECRVEHGALRLFDEELREGTVLQRDPSRRTALIDSVVKKAIARPRVVSTGAEVSRENLTAPLKHRSWAPVFVGGVVTGSLAASVLVVLYFLWSPSEDSLDDERANVVHQEDTPHPGPHKVARPRVLATIGEPECDGSKVVPGSIINVGQTLSAEDGELFLQLDPESRIALSEEAEVSLDSFSDEEIRLTLRTGVIHGQVAPGREGPLLRVVTNHGDAVVRGTVFSLHERDEQFTLQVLRGTVDLEGGSDSSRISVEAGHKATSGTIADVQEDRTDLREVGEDLYVMPLSVEEESLIWAKTQSLELFEVGRDSMLQLTSAPVGARVSIDERYVGRAPLAASLRPGHYLVQIATGDTSLTEAVDLGFGETVERHFDLERAESDAPSHQESSDLQDQNPIDGEGSSASAGSLLREAQALRARRDFAGAERAYLRLLQAHGGSPQATASLVSLGTIELEHLGRPGKALRHFDQYLRASGTGPLAQEALYGKARALRRLGRAALEREALEGFLRQYPNGLQSASVRRRLAEISREEQESEEGDLQ